MNRMGFSKSIVARGRVIGGGTEPLICTPLVGRSRTAILDELSSIFSLKPDLIEWRVDFFEGVADMADVIDLARRLRRDAGDIPLIFTLRSEREGGQPVTLTDGHVAALCEAICAQQVVDFVDFEMSAPAEHIVRVRTACHSSGTQLILSYHNFQETPDAEQLHRTFCTAQSLDGDIAKVAVTPRDLADVLVLLMATLRASRELRLPLISISMGGYGALTRMIGWVFGSSVTFAVGQTSSAPGQIPLEDLNVVLTILRKSLPGS
ncbi:MAG: type I 3-dehydroquinate dehydratase [Rhodanobacter sp.]